MTDPVDIRWDVELDGRSWTGDETQARLEVMPHKREVIAGKLYWSDEDRLMMLAALLENLGAKAAVRIGNAEVWRQAVATLDESH